MIIPWEIKTGKIFRQLFNSCVDFLLALCAVLTHSTLLITVFFIINMVSYLSLTMVFSYFGEKRWYNT